MNVRQVYLPPAPLIAGSQCRAGVWITGLNPPKVERERPAPKDMVRFAYWMRELRKGKE